MKKFYNIKVFIFLFTLCYVLISAHFFPKIDSLIKIVENKNAYQKGTKELLRVCTEIYYQSKEQKYSKGTVFALLHMAEIYYNEGNIQGSLRKIAEGKIIAENINDYSSLSDFYKIEGFCNKTLMMHKRAHTSFQTALIFAEKIPDTDEKHEMKMGIYDGLGINLFQSKNFNKDSLVFYAKNALSEAKKRNRSNADRNIWVSHYSNGLASAYLIIGKTDSARFYSKEAEQYIKHELDLRFFSNIYDTRGRIFAAEKKYDSAIDYYLKSVDIIKKNHMPPQHLRSLYPEIAKSYERLKDYKNSSYYYSLAKNLSDSLDFEERKLLSKDTMSTNDTNMRIHYKYVFVIIIAILVALFPTLYYIKKKKNKQIVLLSSQDDVVQNENSSFRTPNSEDLKDLIQLAKHNDEAFYIKYIEIYPEFSKKLLQINNTLTTSDLEFCALIRLNFDNKQIAQSKKLSVRAVESKKYRLRKKLGLDPQTNIYNWLSSVLVS